MVTDSSDINGKVVTEELNSETAHNKMLCILTCSDGKFNGMEAGSPLRIWPIQDIISKLTERISQSK